MATIDDTGQRTRVEAIDDMVGKRDVKCVLVDHEQSGSGGIDRVSFHTRIRDSEADVLETWSAMYTMPRSTEEMAKLIDAYEQAIDAYQDL
jgi:hypothetical protein